MTTLKQVFLSAAVAGVVAGAGSALGTAVAQAAPTDTGSSASSSESSGRADTQSPGRSRGSATKADTPSQIDSAPSADDTETPTSGNTVRAQGSPRSEPAVERDTADNDFRPGFDPSAGNADQLDSTIEPEAAVEKQAPAVDPIGTEVLSDVAPAAAIPAAAVPAPVASATAEPAVAVEVSPVIAAAPQLSTAPAAPAPTPVRLPLLPDLPAVPVAPASAVTVSATSSTNTRYRAASAVAQAEVLADPPINHVLLIGTDGTNLSKILEYAYDDPASGFRIAMDQGTTGATSMIGHTTISGPSWSTILTGAWDTKTGVINNLFDPEPYKQWPTVFNLIEYNKPAVKTAVIANWQYINDIAAAGGYPADENIYIAYEEADGWEAADDKVAEATIALIEATNPNESTFVFSYQVGVDEEGHLHGGGSTQYRDALINTSENIAQILAAVEEWEATNPGEQWTVIITTDHGHQQSQGLGHGFQSPNETTTFVIFDLEGDDQGDGKQNLGYSNADITPTIVSLFGVAQRSDFDGVPLQTKETGVVAPVDLKQALGDAISMYGYPNIGTDLALGTRTVFASIPYFIDGFVTDITDMLQSVVDQDIFLISGIAEVTKWIIQFNGNLAVGVTQAMARVVAYLTGAGTIPPSDPPLPPAPADSELPWVLDANAVLA
jgi:hypothetical protein